MKAWTLMEEKNPLVGPINIISLMLTLFNHHEIAVGKIPEINSINIVYCPKIKSGIPWSSKSYRSKNI